MFEQHLDHRVGECVGETTAEVVAKPARRAGVEHPLQRGVRHRAEEVDCGLEFAEGSELGLASLKIPRPATHHGDDRLADQVCWHKRLRRRGHDGGQHRSVVRQLRGPLAECAQHVSRTVPAEHHHSAENSAHRMQRELEARDDAEVAAAAAKAPQQVRSFALAGSDDFTGRRDDVRTDQVVAGEAVLAL